MSFKQEPKFTRPKLTTRPTEEMQLEIINAWCNVMYNLGYLKSDEQITSEEIDAAIAAAAEDGIQVISQEKVYNPEEVVYDIIVLQIAAQVTFSKGGENSEV